MVEDPEGRQSGERDVKPATKTPARRSLSRLVRKAPRRTWSLIKRVRKAPRRSRSAIKRVRKALRYAWSAIKTRVRKRRDKMTPPTVLMRSLFRPDIDRKVSVMIAGTMKGGTTALFHFIAQHPEICTSVRKEVHFFDRPSFFHGKPNYRRYHAWFDPQPSHKILFEATARYMFLPEYMEHIREYNPAMRIIIILRNPIDRAYSHWQMNTRKGRERLSFSEVLNRSRGKATEYTDRGYYVGQLEHMWQLFPREQTLILRNEELLYQRDATLKRVFEFAGVSPFTRDDIRRRPKVYEPMSASDRAYLTELFEPEIRSLERLLGWDCSDWLPDAAGRRIAKAQLA